jgi:hypothetical protein
VQYVLYVVEGNINPCTNKDVDSRFLLVVGLGQIICRNMPFQSTPQTNSIQEQEMGRTWKIA